MQPLGFLSVPNHVTGSFQFNLTNAPTLGSIVIESSTNLMSWSPVVTNTASASTNSYSYSFPAASSPHRFYPRRPGAVRYDLRFRRRTAMVGTARRAVTARTVGGTYRDITSDHAR